MKSNRSRTGVPSFSLASLQNSSFAGAHRMYALMHLYSMTAIQHLPSPKCPLFSYTQFPPPPARPINHVCTYTTQLPTPHPAPRINTKPNKYQSSSLRQSEGVGNITTMTAWSVKRKRKCAYVQVSAGEGSEYVRCKRPTSTLVRHAFDLSARALCIREPRDTRCESSLLSFGPPTHTLSECIVAVQSYSTRRRRDGPRHGAYRSVGMLT
jgi:hypothetical protein